MRSFGRVESSRNRETGCPKDFTFNQSILNSHLQGDTLDTNRPSSCFSRGRPCNPNHSQVGRPKVMFQNFRPSADYFGEPKAGKASYSRKSGQPTRGLSSINAGSLERYREIMTRFHANARASKRGDGARKRGQSSGKPPENLPGPAQHP
jgi:hypothetical protein